MQLIATVLATIGTAGAAEPAVDDDGWAKLLDRWASATTVEATVKFVRTSTTLRGGADTSIRHLYAGRTPPEVLLADLYTSRPKATVYQPDEKKVFKTDTVFQYPRTTPVPFGPFQVVMDLLQQRLSPCTTAAVPSESVLFAPQRGPGHYHWREVKCPGLQRSVYVAYGYAPEDKAYATPILDRIVAKGPYGPIIVHLWGARFNEGRPAWLGEDRLLSAKFPGLSLVPGTDHLEGEAIRQWRSAIDAYERGEQEHPGEKPDADAEPVFFKPK
jgi:hypothetical protein